MSKTLFNVKEFVNQYNKTLKDIDNKEIILSFSSSAAKKVSLKYPSKRVHALGAAFDIYEDFEKIIVSQFGVGAPAAILQLEYLKELGATDFYSLGLVSSLSDDLKIGDAVFIEEAYKSESNEEIKLSCKNPHSNFTQYKAVKSLTTHFPFQETKKNLPNQISCLEMEAYYLMNHAQTYNLKMDCLGFVSDSIHSDHWKMGFSDQQLQADLTMGLENLLKRNKA